MAQIEGPSVKRFEFTQVQMGAPMTIVLYASDEKIANSAAQKAFDRVSQLNSRLSDYDPKSELSRLSATSGLGRVAPISRDLLLVLARSQQLARRTGGAFDVTVGPLVKLWRRARRIKEMPSESRRNEALKAVGHQHLRLDKKRSTAELRRPGMRLDLGGIAKGFAADEALAVLRREGMHQAMINAGGDIVVGDAPPGKPGWRIGIAPLDADAPPSRFLTLSRMAIATSGDAWQHVVIDGKRYSHLIDPRTGLGLTDHSSVTVIAHDGITADSLASGVSVLGPKLGVRLVDETAGAAAFIVRNVDGKIETHQSKRWADFKIETPSP